MNLIDKLKDIKVKKQPAAAPAAVKAARESTAAEQQPEAIIGAKRSFAMAEAHKRLRTNIMFSFADESECHIIGVTSAMAHEGKSTTSINLAYDLMKAGKSTLLVDADMRLSRIGKYLGVDSAPGLSNMLVGNCRGQSVVQYSAEYDNLAVISCGDLPPNPTELLSSKRFEMVLNVLKETYEYIIVDLPPVAEVSDALIASKLMDGMIVVVRQDYVDKRILDDAIHQLNLSNARIIGLVMNCAHYETKYGKYKYKKYGKSRYGYYKRYGYKRYGYKRYGYYSDGRHFMEEHIPDQGDAASTDNEVSGKKE